MGGLGETWGELDVVCCSGDVVALSRVWHNLIPKLVVFILKQLFLLLRVLNKPSQHVFKAGVIPAFNHLLLQVQEVKYLCKYAWHDCLLRLVSLADLG